MVPSAPLSCGVGVGAAAGNGDDRVVVVDGAAIQCARRHWYGDNTPRWSLRPVSVVRSCTCRFPLSYPSCKSRVQFKNFRPSRFILKIRRGFKKKKFFFYVKFYSFRDEGGDLRKPRNINRFSPSVTRTRVVEAGAAVICICIYIFFFLRKFRLRPFRDKCRQVRPA